MPVPVLDQRRLTDALEAQGFTLKPVRRGGWVVLAPDGVGTSMIHRSVFRTQSGRRAYRNLLAELRRIGFDVEAAL